LVQTGITRFEEMIRFNAERGGCCSRARRQMLAA